MRHGHSTDKHGKSPTYNSWAKMKDRCLNPKQFSYHRYGGRGITICERWMEFTNFLSDMGERPDGMVIDRINNDGNYEPANCRWVSHKENCNNTKNCKYIAGMTISQLCAKMGVSVKKVYVRKCRGRPLFRRSDFPNATIYP